MAKGKNLVGNKYGLLTVISKTEKTDVRRGFVYLCKCDCGNYKEVPTSYLTRGSTRSCGCLVNIPNEKRVVTAKSPKYQIPDELKNIRSEVVGDGNLIAFENGEIYRITKFGEKECVRTPNKNGYITVSTYVDGRQKHFYVHRLMAEAFIDNPESKPQVNHKDGNKSNNDLNNLEWATHKENVNHAYANGLIDTYKNGVECSVCNRLTNSEDSVCPVCKKKINAAEKYKEKSEKLILSLETLDIETLTPKQKEAVLLAKEGMSVSEIANVLGKTRQAVSKLLIGPGTKKQSSKANTREMDRLSKKLKKKELKLELLKSDVTNLEEELVLLKEKIDEFGG